MKTSVVERVINVQVSGARGPVDSKPWLKVGAPADIPTAADEVYREVFTAIGVDTEDETPMQNAKLMVKAQDEGIAIQTKVAADATGYDILLADVKTLYEPFPDYRFNIRRFDGVNGVEPSPNVVFRQGFNTQNELPNLVRLEDAWEYNYNLNVSDPPYMVVERHVGEFEPLAGSGRPTQRFASWAARLDGTRTDYSLVGDIVSTTTSGNVQVTKQDHTNAGYSLYQFMRGVKISSESETQPIEIENKLKIGGEGTLYTDNDSILNFGTTTFKNLSVFNGWTIGNGAVMRLKTVNNTSGFDFRIPSINSFDIVDVATGNEMLRIYAGAPNQSLVIRASGNTGFGVSSPVHPIEHSSGAHLTAAGAWTNASDIAHKSEIKDTKYGLQQVMQLKAVDYIHTKSDIQQTGFIAQDVKDLMPEYVSGEDGNMGINYGQMVAVLTKAIQELNNKIEALN